MNPPSALAALILAEGLLDSVAHISEPGDTTEPLAYIRDAIESLKASSAMEEMHVAIVSTRHVTKEDGERLLVAHPRDVLATFYDSTGHIVVWEDIDEDLPESKWSSAFRALVHHFDKLGFSYLRIDANGPAIAGFPTFDW